MSGVEVKYLWFSSSFSSSLLWLLWLLLLLLWFQFLKWLNMSAQQNLLNASNSTCNLQLCLGGMWIPHINTVDGRNPGHLRCMKPCKLWDRLPTSTGWQDFSHHSTNRGQKLPKLLLCMVNKRLVDCIYPDLTHHLFVDEMLILGMLDFYWCMLGPKGVPPFPFFIPTLCASNLQIRLPYK